MKDGTPVSAEVIYSNIKAILNEKLISNFHKNDWILYIFVFLVESNEGNPVGWFTTLNRDEWAKIRDNMMTSSQVTRESLQVR